MIVIHHHHPDDFSSSFGNRHQNQSCFRWMVHRPYSRRHRNESYHYRHRCHHASSSSSSSSYVAYVNGSGLARLFRRFRLLLLLLLGIGLTSFNNFLPFTGFLQLLYLRSREVLARIGRPVDGSRLQSNKHDNYDPKLYLPYCSASRPPWV